MNARNGRGERRASARDFAAALLLSAAAVAAPAIAAPTSILLPQGAPFPESVTSTAAGALYASSISEGGVTRVRPGASQAEVFIAPGTSDTRSTFGVLADEKSNTLWVCSNDASAIGLPGPTAVKGAFLKGFDLDSGAAKISLPLPNAPALCNDIAIGPDGSAYVTNTAAPELLRWRPGSTKLEVWLSDPALKGGVDGLAFGPDGNLYVNTFYSGELFRVDVDNGEAKKLTRLETSRPLKHPDALKPFGDGFVMVEGAGPLSRVTISGDRATIKTIENFAGPTGVTLVGDTAWIAEGQLDFLFDPDKKDKPRPQFHLRAKSLDQQ